MCTPATVGVMRRATSSPIVTAGLSWPPETFIVRRNHQRQDQAVRERNLEQAGRVAGVRRHHDRAATDEDQREGADEFGDEVRCHGDVGGRR